MQNLQSKLLALTRRSSVKDKLQYIRDKPYYVLTLLLLPSLVIMFTFLILPVILMIATSFSSGQPPASFTLENYIRIFDSLYIGILWYTALLAVQTMLLIFVMGYTLAYSIVRFSKRTTLLLLLIILPFWTNYIVRMYAWINILQQGGGFDWLLLSMSILSEPQGYLYTHSAVLIGLMYVWLPLATFPFYASLSQMNMDLIDAAKDLGAGPIKTFFTITLPMTSKGIIAGIVLVLMPAFGAFITPRLLGGTNQITLGMVIDNQFNQAFNWPFGAALAIFLTLIVLLLLGLGSKFGSVAMRRRDSHE